MADDVNISDATGTAKEIVTDEVSSKHYQRIKLNDGTPDSTDYIPGDSVHGLDVDVTRVTGTVTVDGSAVTQPVSVTTLPALAAGAQIIGSLTANQTTNTAQINGVAPTMGEGATGTGVQRVTLPTNGTGNIATIGTSVTPGTAAAHLGKAEDSPHTSGDVGVGAWAVRNDTVGALATTNLDYIPLTTNSQGALYVTPVGAAAHVSVASTGLTVATTAYTSGDTLGNEMTFAGFARATGGTGSIVSAAIIDKNKVLGTVDLFIFSAASTPSADNAANAWSDANASTLLQGVIHCNDVIQSANNNVIQASGPFPLGYTCSVTSLFVVAVTRTANAIFAAASDMQVILHALVD